MYFPYLRGKQEEQFAVLEANPTIYAQNKVLPIFEPCVLKQQNINRYETMCKKGIPFIIIVNPQVGERPIPTIQNVMGMINGQLAAYNNYIVGFIVTSATTQTQLQQFVNGVVPNHRIALIHEGEFGNTAFFQTINASIEFHIFKDDRVSQRYITVVGAGCNTVLLSDGFNRQSRNSDYSGSEHFSDLHSRYSALGFDGFGDYQCIGFRFLLGGGPANAVAIHMTYDDQTSINCEHFVSTSNQGAADPAGKFLEALDQLVNTLNANPGRFYQSTGVDDFRALHTARHFPQLGKVKRISTKHHLELVASLI